MAKPSKKKSNVNVDLLKKIGSGEVNFISQEDGLPLLNNSPPLIEVNTASLDPNDANKAAVRLTDTGKAMVADPVAETAKEEAAPVYEIMSGYVPPASKRGNRGGGAPTQYPFDKLEIGQVFFVPISAKHPDPVKTLGSTVSSANRRFSEPTGEMKTVKRTKRGEGNKAMRDAAGKPIREDATVEVRKPLRKFAIKPAKKGEKYGDIVAPYDGAAITRVAL